LLKDIMKKKDNFIKIDSRNRITIPTEFCSDEVDTYKVYEENGCIVLEPVYIEEDIIPEFLKKH